MTMKKLKLWEIFLAIILMIMGVGAFLPIMHPVVSWLLGIFMIGASVCIFLGK